MVRARGSVAASTGDGNGPSGATAGEDEYRARFGREIFDNMAHSKANVLIHLVWGTRDRMPCIDARIEDIIHEVIGAQCKRLESPLLAFGASDDHVHCVIALSRKQSIVTFARAAKSASTVFVNRASADKFGWQRGYGAFSVSERDPSGALAYVRDQRERHATNRVEAEWEQWWVEDGED